MSINFLLKRSDCSSLYENIRLSEDEYNLATKAYLSHKEIYYHYLSDNKSFSDNKSYFICKHCDNIFCTINDIKLMSIFFHSTKDHSLYFNKSDINFLTCSEITIKNILE